MADGRLDQHRWFDGLLLGVDNFLALDVFGFVSFQTLHCTKALGVGFHLRHVTNTLSSIYIPGVGNSDTRQLDLALTQTWANYGQ